MQKTPTRWPLGQRLPFSATKSNAFKRDQKVYGRTRPDDLCCASGSAKERETSRGGNHVKQEFETQNNHRARWINEQEGKAFKCRWTNLWIRLRRIPLWQHDLLGSAVCKERAYLGIRPLLLISHCLQATSPPQPTPTASSLSESGKWGQSQADSRR